MIAVLFRFAAQWAGARLREKSTYTGLFILLAGHLGLYFSPEMQSMITQTLIDGSGALLLAVSGQDAVRHYATAAGRPDPLPGGVAAVPTPKGADEVEVTAELNRKSLDSHRS